MAESAAPLVDLVIPRVPVRQIITRLLKMLTRRGHLVEEQGMTYIADVDADNPLASWQAVSCIYCIALGPRCACCSTVMARSPDG